MVQESTITLPGVRWGTIHVPYKYIALALLLFQTTVVVLCMRSSRKPTDPADPSSVYLLTTAVVMSELFKMFGSVLMLWYEKQEQGLGWVLQHMWEELVNNPTETSKLAVPSGLYTLQNNLLFIALSNLDATTYQVTYQLKILTTAVFSVAMLGKSLDSRKWMALFMLMGGVALVQMPAESSHAAAPAKGNSAVGLLAVLLACCSSGFAGVYFEKILKGSSQSVWVRNFQLGLFSVLLGLGGVVANDWAKVQSKGFFQYYDNMTWFVIFLQAFGGLVVAAVIKYADNILKTFANAVSILLTGLVSFFLMDDFPLTFYFLSGSGLVIAATFLYSAEKPPPSTRPKATP